MGDHKLQKSVLRAKNLYLVQIYFIFPIIRTILNMLLKTTIIHGSSVKNTPHQKKAKTAFFIIVCAASGGMKDYHV